jgi:hypothetical protein
MRVGHRRQACLFALRSRFVERMHAVNIPLRKLFHTPSNANKRSVLIDYALAITCIRFARNRTRAGTVKNCCGTSFYPVLGCSRALLGTSGFNDLDSYVGGYPDPSRTAGNGFWVATTEAEYSSDKFPKKFSNQTILPLLITRVYSSSYQLARQLKSHPAKNSTAKTGLQVTFLALRVQFRYVPFAEAWPPCPARKNLRQLLFFWHPEAANSLHAMKGPVTLRGIVIVC